MSKDNRHDGRRRGAGQHRLGPRVSQGGDGRERSGSNSSGSSHGGGKSKNTSITALKASFQRSNSHDKVRKIVAEEGRTARNLIAWSVPLENKEEEAKSKNNSSSSSRVQRINAGQQRNKKQNAGVENKGTAGGLLDKGAEKSPTKVRQPRKVDLRARYWAFLFDNLRRAVDEIYVTCESDQSVVECKEVLMMLNNYVRDFKALIDWIQLQEKLENTDAQNRPTSLAWEVRKMSPGRHVMPGSSGDRMIPSPGARRTLNFGGPPPTLAAARFSHSGPSWADRVKCTQSLPSQTTTSAVEKSGNKDAEGWETVQRGRTARPRSAAMVAKVSPVLAQVTPKQDSVKDNGPHLLPQGEQQLQPQCHPDKDSTQTDDEQRVPAEPDPLEKVGSPGNKHTLELPAESIQDSGQCVDAPCEDAPPPIAAHTPSQAPEANPSSATVPPTDITISIPVPSLAHCSSSDPAQTEGLDVLLVLGDSGAEGGASQGMATSAPGQAETPMAAVKLESVLDPTELSTPQSMAEVLAKKEELADRLEKANEEAIASAIAEEEQLTREILAENNELETDNESDFSAAIGNGGCGAVDWSEMLADYDAREPWRQSTSWGDIVEEEPSRPPGHGIHMHEKLSSPSRKRTIAESKKKHEEKQLKAQQQRDKLREEKTLKLQKLLEREKEVRKWKEELLEQRRRMMDEKLLHAEFKRELQLQAIVKKAQEEEAKVNEIAFINTLEAQNKRHDALAKLNEYEQRLNELQEDRQRRQEEKQARDEAVQERKRVLEAERQARVEELLMRRKEQEARIEHQKQEKEKAREDAARERARDREERLAALSAAQQEAMEELQKKIQMKHDESSRRHMEQIEQRKEKAAELSSGRHANTDYAPKLTPYERKKQCSLCGVMITSEVHLFSHTKGKRHQQAVRDSSSIQGRELSDEEVEHLSLKKYIVDIVTDSSVSSESMKHVEERQKARKKAKKLRTRMNSRAKEYEMSMEAKTQLTDSPYKAKLQRLVKDLLKQLQGQDSGQWANNKVSGLDRTLGEISRILEKQNNADQVAFQVGGGLSALEQILHVITAASTPTAVPRIPLKSLCAAVNTYYLACSCCPLNCSYVLFSNKIALLMDLLLHQLTLYVPDNESIFGRSVNKQVFEGLTTGLLQTIATILGSLWPYLSESGQGENTWISSPDAKVKTATESFNTRTQDLISYVVNMGLIDKLYGCFLSVQSPVDEQPKMSAFLQQASTLLHSMCKLCFVVTGRAPSIFDNKRQDPTGLTALLQSTDLVGVVHTLYCILLHSFSPESASQSQEPYGPGVIQVAVQGIRFLNSFALLDLSAFQSVLGAEGLSLAFRHIVSSLLWYCSQHSSEELLHEVITCVGYFTVNHPDNQVIVQSGRQPSVLQKLCQLPFQYFSHPRLIKVLFPSLISACYNNPQNKVILQQEMSCVLLATFIQDCAANEKESDNKKKQGVSQMLDFCELSNRFPRDQWDSALQFFLKKQEE
ncbi:putative S phase cyclin A-associated protein in the endoplasmic reticulum [Scophthalmus maximus]|uniref:Putative S phase cyclin A-associated protein in the endoplasmic reticulum n=1 Tax=Scophthalmus maximus TaxID=52904 RepID=A0A2U9BWI5_SCOMX|nr:S phase cyclin A-associated protein in the endoplasmic reticulum isoform X1 [Scophthalmus maximus]XP_035497129.1 S phase cyclin A-associated protein in the endoplasmic reticulum isoform X1 [Scophthalmus maximus]AWP08461.1 putative S phase cyclin A-associated protein in the endoplasmic reticulum [Scophthalmus maximus]